MEAENKENLQGFDTFHEGYIESGLIHAKCLKRALKSQNREQLYKVYETLTDN